MNKPKRASKSSDEIINEIFDTLHLPVTEEHSKISKVSSSNKGCSSDITRDSPNELSDSDSSSSSDQEIDKLLEEITEVTDKDIKIDEADFALAQKDKKKKKKKVKKSNSTKTKHKKRKKKKSSKVRNSPDSELDFEKSKENKLSKSFSSEAIKDRSHSPDLDKTFYNKKSKPKSVNSRSRSKSLSKRGSRSRSRSRSRYTRSRSRSRSKYIVSKSKSRSYYNYNNNTSKSRYNRSPSSSYSDLDYNSKRSKSRKRDPSRSPSYSPPKSRRRETKSRSPGKRKDKEPLDSWKSTKLTTQKKSNTPPKPDSAGSKAKESKSEESTKSSTFINSETNSDIKIIESVKTPISDKTMTKESNNQSAVKVEGNSAENKTPDISTKGQEKLKDEGKGKMIVIKNLKESSVLQQAEEAQNKSKDNIDPAENNAPLVFDIKKEEISEKPLKEEKSQTENLLTAFKKTKKEKEESDKDKKDVKKTSKSRSRSRSLVRTSRRSRSRSRGSVSKPYGKRKRSRSTSRSRKRRSKSRDRYKKRSRSRSRSKRSASRDRYRGGKRSRSGSRSKDFSKNRGGKSSTSSKDKRKSPDCVDSLRDKATRKRLLDIARKNAVYLMKNNCLPPSIEKESVLRATGKSIEELTSFCKQLVSKGDYSDGELSDPSLSPEEHESFSSSVHHHPFAVKDKPIMMNIRNAPMLPTKTNAERLADASKLREQFPVSSGSHHRTVESDWVPVAKDDSKDGRSDKVFPDDCSRDIDISNLVSTRLNAMRRLQDNPTDKEAMKILSSAQKDMQNWALSKQVPGQFTGSTGARILTAEQLSSGYQAWAKKGQFSNASPVTSQFGMKILQKMGWNPGEGLGKNKEGGLVPLIIDVKNDKKGLAAVHEIAPRKQAIPLAKTLQGKHPVSALVELCFKRKWAAPEFEIVYDSGPDHKKNYLIQVHVNNQTFKTSCAATTKKIAKANAAAACLQAMGLIPEEGGAAPVKSQETLNTTGQLAAADPGSTSTVPAPETEESSSDNTQATEASQKGTSRDKPKINLGSNYNLGSAATNSESGPQYSADNSQASATPYVSDGTMANYINDTSQTASQYDSSVMSQYQSHYSSDGTQGMVQYGDNQAMGAYSAEAMAQYSTNGTQDMSHYQANSTEAMAQYSSTDAQAQYSTTDPQAQYSSTDPQAQYSSTDPQAMAQYAQSAMGQYSSDGSQTSLAQYSQAYQQYSAEAIQAYQQQYSSSNSQSQSGAFTFPQPPRSLTHGITTEGGATPAAAAASSATDNGSANHGSRGDSSASNDSRSHSDSGSQSHSYRNGNNSYGGGSYNSSNSSSYNQTQYYDGSYQQGSQQY